MVLAGWGELVSLLLYRQQEQKPGGILIQLQEYTHTCTRAHTYAHMYI